MENEKIIKILTKAKILRTFSYGSLGRTSITKDEFDSICSALCDSEVLRKIQKEPTYATGGRGNSRLITFETDAEYSLMISEEECQAIIDEFN